MNFLEELVAEWYDFNDYFVKKNVHMESLPKGGRKGEMDVIAFNPMNKDLVHIEISSDAYSWEERKKIFIKKFNDAQNQYSKLFPFEHKNVKKIVIAGFAKKHQKEISWGEDIEIKSISEVTIEIIKTLKEYRNTVPEGYPLLRAIQTTFQALQE